MDQTIQTIEEHNPNLKGVFLGITYKYLEDNILFQLILKLDQVGILPSKANGSAATLAQSIKTFTEEILSFFLKKEGKAAGETSTPKEISILLARLLDIEKGTVYDGTAGLANSLIEAQKVAHNKKQNIEMIGQEVHKETWALARKNLILHGLYRTEFYLSDSIKEPLIKDNKLQTFDYVLMDPPVNLKDWGQEIAEKDLYGRFRFGVPSAAYGDMAFISHAVASLKSNGKAVIIVPQGVLIRGAVDQRIRKALLEEDLIESVIGLPSNVYVGVHVPVAVLVINKRKDPKRKGYVQFINTENDFEKNRSKHILREEDIDKIVQAYTSIKNIEEYSKLVSTDEIAQNEWSLHHIKYFEKAEVETKFGTVKINKNTYQSLDIPKVKLKSIAEVFRGINPPKQVKTDGNHNDLIQGKYKLINLSDVHDGKISFEQLKHIHVEDPIKVKRYEVLPGDIILSSRGTVLKLAVIPETEDSILLSNNFIGIRPVNKSRYSSYYLKAFLESPIGLYYLEANQRGSAVTVLSPKDIESIPVLDIPLEKQIELTDFIIEADREYEQTISEAKRKQEEQYDLFYRQLGIEEAMEKTIMRP